MLRNLLSPSKTVIKLLQRQQRCIQLPKLRQNQIYQYTIFLYTNSASFKYSSICTTPTMSLANASVSLTSPSLTVKCPISTAGKITNDNSSEDPNLISKSKVSGFIATTQSSSWYVVFCLSECGQVKDDHFLYNINVSAVSESIHKC